MKKAYYLSTCDTCKRILKELNLSADWKLQDIKADKITLEQLEEMRSMTDSYESLLNRRARKLSEFKGQELSEEKLKSMILEEYTFLKRPVFVMDKEIFIGNAKKTVESLKAKLGA
ncbi:MAG: ArsC/Spx/MgsR family protein [Flavobacteriales bacterium]|jgi:arsenate reductase|tara:strand:- start:45 stop:392 length:348 start_codon:yes stop_codon:yes gene_type:complete